MEILASKTEIKDIFKSTWHRFVAKFGRRIRPAVFENVWKVLNCKEGLGGKVFICPKCVWSKVMPFTCKSRFCSSCGKIQTDIWMQKAERSFPNVPYHHITLTIPEQLRVLVQCNRRQALDILFKAAYGAILKMCSDRGYTPLVMSVVHTFGRDLTFNPHIHLLVSCGGLTPQQTWKQNFYLYHETLKKLWRYNVITALRAGIKDQTIKNNLPDKVFELLNDLYTKYKNWYVHIGKTLSNAKQVVRYIGRYTKRPAMAASRIISFKDNVVTFWYEDHKTDKHITAKLDVLDFIGKLIVHIHDKRFCQIRYAGLLAPRRKTAALALIATLLNAPTPPPLPKVTWQQRLIHLTGVDPLKCPHCHERLIFYEAVYATPPAQLAAS